ncbi:MAG: hypothetical protein IPK58_24835 [Acidobacteria bacterium]|nr:hypothetical protein [Acidobacteriota bacterium]
MTITADARIDNREELLRLLVPEAAKEVTITDSELMLRAFRKWRESCPEHLLGDFVFAIWDDSNKSLFCARDHMGVRPSTTLSARKAAHFRLGDQGDTEHT